jgi:hypothetical protein
MVLLIEYAVIVVAASTATRLRMSAQPSACSKTAPVDITARC